MAAAVAIRTKEPCSEFTGGQPTNRHPTTRLRATRVRRPATRWRRERGPKTLQALVPFTYHLNELGAGLEALVRVLSKCPAERTLLLYFQPGQVGRFFAMAA